MHKLKKRYLLLAKIIGVFAIVFVYDEYLYNKVQRYTDKLTERDLRIMNRIAEFKKVSFSQFLNGWIDTFKTGIEKYEEEKIREIYDNIILPTRSTTGSAGYDFKAPFDIKLLPGESIKIPTGVRCKINDGWVLTLYPRSGLGTKYRMQLDNTIGVVDSDYFGSRNEGHIFAKFTNDSKDEKILEIKKGDGFMQGIFMPYGIVVDDHVVEVRNGGFGSTGR